ncbi:MAG: SDR family NAD(P)-dependent oxidoreductase, partial [Solimonas sp.]
MSTFPDRFRLDGRTALITGSGRGLGWEMAKGLAEAGARVLLHGRSRERLQPRLDELKATGHEAGALCFDMADRAAMQAEVGQAGPIDVLVHNVGERDRRPFSEIEPDAFARLIDVDLVAAHALVRRVVPGMIAQGWGRLILVTSIVAGLSVPGSASYTAAKAGLAALARTLAAELGAT